MRPKTEALSDFAATIAAWAITAAFFAAVAMPFAIGFGLIHAAVS